jgi:hypothetical protein
MPFGAEPIEFVLFLRQVGFALAGAAALWGFMFTKVRAWVAHEERCTVLEWIAGRLFIPLLIGIMLAVFSWLTLLVMVPAYAHEGISLAPSLESVYRGLELAAPLMILLVVLTLAGLAMFRFRSGAFHRNLAWFYALQFAVILVLISVQVWTGEFADAQWFFIGHSVHSIFTVGTVLILDFLFLTAKSSPILKQHIFPLFPTISKVIWVGLAIDFASVFLVFPEAVGLTPKFFFMQTVIGILVINGVLLAGPITRKLLASVGEGGERMAVRWMVFADLAGTVSITSWLTITFLDAFHALTLGYTTLALFYVALIAFLFVGHLFWERMHREPLLLPLH